MKKVLFAAGLSVLLGLFTACATTAVDSSKNDITQYYAESDADCTFIFEFFNQSGKELHVTNYITENKKLLNQYTPVIYSEDIAVPAGTSYVVKINSDRLLKDYKNGYSIAINCYEKAWHWNYTIDKQMKFKRARIIVKNDLNEGADMVYPPFHSENKFIVNEFTVDYNDQQYMAYKLSDTPEDSALFYDTRIFNVTRSGRFANVYNYSCKNIIEEMLNNGEYTVLDLDGGKYLMLNADPLDLENYIEPENYDFIYEIINNTSGKITVANIMYTDNSRLLGFTKDIEIEQGQSYEFKYDLKTLQKVYGYNTKIGCDVKTETSSWIRGWLTKIDWYNQKYTLCYADGTEDRLIDSYDLWSELLKVSQKSSQ